MRLYKDIKNKMIFGVCSGIAQYSGIDVSIIRLLTILFTFATGSILFWIYLLLAIILPQQPE